MNTKLLRCALLSTAFVCLLGFAGEESLPAELNFTVTKTFDGKEFSCEMKLVSRHFAYQLYRFKFPSPVETPVAANNTVHGKYYWPADMKPYREGGEKRPAIVCLHILGRDFTLIDILCSALAARGIPAMMIELPYYGERTPPDGANLTATNAGLFAQAMAQAVQDTRRTIDMLQARPEVNAERIGLAGISMGGILTGTAAAADERIHRAALILAGGNLPLIIGHSRETKQMRAAIEALTGDARKQCDDALTATDPLTGAPKLRARAADGRVLMYNAREDEVIAPERTNELAEALGLKDKVRWLDGMTHYTALAALPKILNDVCDFFATDLPASAIKTAAAPPKQSAHGIVAALLRDFSRAVLFPDNETAKCCFVDVEVTATPQLKQKLPLRFLRSGGNRFRLEGTVPTLGKIAMGQGEFPWMLSKSGVLYKGVKNPVAGRGPLAFADAANISKIQSGAGALIGFALFPATLDTLVNLDMTTSAEGQTALRLAGKVKSAKDVSLVLTLKKDGTTPEHLKFEARDTKAEITFREWQTAGPAVAELFEPPQAASVIEVEQEELQRIFSAFFNRVVEEGN